jgi:hypothetical protein
VVVGTVCSSFGGPAHPIYRDLTRASEPNAARYCSTPLQFAQVEQRLLVAGLELQNLLIERQGFPVLSPLLKHHAQIICSQSRRHLFCDFYPPHSRMPSEGC